MMYRYMMFFVLLGICSLPVSAEVAQSTVYKEAEPQNQEKAQHVVRLESAGSQQLQVIKAVRQARKDLGLIEAKQLVESAPINVVECVSEEEAREIKALFEEAGATVTLL